MVRTALRAGMLGCACLLAGCSLFRLPGTAAEPGPVRQRIAEVDQAGAPMPSPDGKKLVWHVVAEGEITTLVRRFDSGYDTGETVVLSIGRNFPYWMQDSRHLILEQDIGTGGTHILLLDTEKPNPRPLDLTPWEGVKSFVIHVGNKPPADKIIFVSNRRERASFDVYEADIRTARVDMVIQNSGDVVQWVMDEDGTVGARVRRQDEYFILQVLNKTSRTWKSVYKWRQTEAVLPMRIERDAGKVTLVAKREKTEMVEIHLAGIGK